MVEVKDIWNKCIFIICLYEGWSQIEFLHVRQFKFFGLPFRVKFEESSRFYVNFLEYTYNRAQIINAAMTNNDHSHSVAFNYFEPDGGSS